MKDKSFNRMTVAVVVTGILLSVAFWAVVLWALVHVVQSID